MLTVNTLMKVPGMEEDGVCVYAYVHTHSVIRELFHVY